jgi:hypothetical protein
MVHIHNYNIDMAHVIPSVPEDSPRTFIRRIYGVLYIMDINTRPPSDVQIVKKFPSTAWAKVWENINDGGFSDTTKSIWDAVVHDILPNNSWLATIQMSSTNACSVCGQPDTIQHRITECGECPIIWNWTKQKIGLILRMNPHYIPREWTVRPDFCHWPPQRHAVIIWIIGHLIHYCVHMRRRLTNRLSGLPATLPMETAAAHRSATINRQVFRAANPLMTS